MLTGEDLELFERSLRAATEQHHGPALDAALGELGWADAIDVDPRASIRLLFELQGEANATSTSLERVLLHALGIAPTAGARLALPAIGAWAPPGTVDGARVQVHGVVTGGLADDADVLVVAGREGQHVAIAVPAGQLERRDVHGVDPDLGVVELRGEAPVADPVEPIGSWDDALRLGRLSVGHELVGASRTMLALAREHALERIQFGAPIASFQAVRHRLAETLVAVETASGLLDAAWLDGTDLTATMAKAAAGREARVAAKHCQQVLAGIGFTTEHDLHHFVRRVLVLEGMLGTTKQLTKLVGDHLVASRQLPPILPL